MNAPRIVWISPGDPPDAFPAVADALIEPDGLLAAGGDLSEARLLYAYRHGIFPWYDSGQPILWWSPDPRCVLRPDRLHISRRLRRSLRNKEFLVSFNDAFPEVIAACAEDRDGQRGTWITGEMLDAYCALHDQGWAHSVEVWREDKLIGGLYGIAIGNAFFGESMFSRAADASKAALVVLCSSLESARFEILDCQVVSPHLQTLGAELMERAEFCRRLGAACRPAVPCDCWPEGRIEAVEHLPA